jgi:DHA2 family multidrug resistance protein
MSERRQNFHQATIGSNAASSPWLRNAVTQTAAYLHSHGMSQTDAMAAAYARFYDQLQAQPRLLLAFMDCFYILGLVTRSSRRLWSCSPGTSRQGVRRLPRTKASQTLMLE